MIYKILGGLGIFIVLLVIFVLSYVFNKRAKVPDDCPKELLNSGCASCMMSCSAREEEYSLKKTLLAAKEKDDEEQEESDEAKDDEKGEE